MLETEIPEQKKKITAADRLKIVFYTDPLCCWSRAVQQHLGVLNCDAAGAIAVRYCMGGLIESWNSYQDAENAICRPVQMGPLWMQAGHITGMQLNNSIWVTDPPSSSYLACTAVKCVQLQDAQAGIEYFSLLQDALMIRGINIAKQSALCAIATELCSRFPSFSVERFKQDLVNGSGFRAFSEDLAEVRSMNITRFPTLLISGGNDRALILTGYRPYETIVQAIQQLTGP
jgi:predicted DsbA family dithiol-disulfide isomerase